MPKPRRLPGRQKSPRPLQAAALSQQTPVGALPMERGSQGEYSSAQTTRPAAQAAPPPALVMRRLSPDTGVLPNARATCACRDCGPTSRPHPHRSQCRLQTAGCPPAHRPGHSRSCTCWLPARGNAHRLLEHVPAGAPCTCCQRSMPAISTQWPALAPPRSHRPQLCIC